MHTNTANGIDWVRYQRELLVPIYLPAYKDLDKEARKHGRRGILMEDGAKTHHVTHHDEYHDKFDTVRMGKEAVFMYMGKELKRVR